MGATSLKTIESPTGNVLTKYDILNMNVTRWLPYKKAIFVTALTEGLVTEDDLLTKYPNLSSEELNEWVSEYKAKGVNGLKVTYRPNTGKHLSERGRQKLLGGRIARGEISLEEAVNSFSFTSIEQLDYWAKRAKQQSAA